MTLLSGFCDSLCGWLWSQSLAVVPFLAVVWLASRLRFCRDVRVLSVLWSLVFVRLIWPTDWLSPGAVAFDAQAWLPVSEPLSFGTHAVAWDVTSSPAPVSPNGWVMVWLVLVLALLVRWGMARWRFHRLVARAEPVLRGDVLAVLDLWRSAHGISRPVRVVCGSVGLGPFTLGSFRPVIFLPREVLLGPTEALEAALAHELAHIRGWDDLKIMAQRLIATLFFFHPAVYLAGHRLNLCREMVRDQDVLSLGLLDFRRYGKGLLAAVQLSPIQPAGLAALGNGLSGRIRALVNHDGLLGRSRFRHRFVALVGLCCLPLLGLSSGDVTPGSWLHPVPDGRVTSPFGMRVHPFSGKHVLHRGTDIAGDKGWPIVAPADGRVILATSQAENPSWGTVIVLQHGGDYQSLFAHLDALRVSEGQRVEAGQIIGTVGDSGKVTAPHLHLEVKHGKELIDAAVLIPALKFP